MTTTKRVTHFGTVTFGDLKLEAAVLEDGSRGFVQNTITQLIGFAKETRGPRFRRFLKEMAPNALETLNKKGGPVRMPSGQKANWISWEVLPEIVESVTDAVFDGTLHPQRQHLVAPCRTIQKALMRVGLTALIDEATGYQYHREPDALQQLFAKLLRMDAMEWERRFSPEYYGALCRLFGWDYNRFKHRPLPNVIGQITQDWVYGIAFPGEIMDEIKTRKKERFPKLPRLRPLQKSREGMSASSSKIYRRCATAHESRYRIRLYR